MNTEDMKKERACDTCTRLTPETADKLKKEGYTDVGRYLTNCKGPKALDKKITEEEKRLFQEFGLKVFPIFQKSGRRAAYFTGEQGLRDATEAKAAKEQMGFNPDAVVFFAVDYDATISDIRGHIVPYFRAIISVLKPDTVGVYGSRMVCLELEKEGLAAVSFVADMSHGYGGNKGKPMPKNWAYAQIKGNKVGSLCIDECVKSERATAFIPA